MEPVNGGDRGRPGRHREVTVRRLREPGDIGWVLMTHGEAYSSEFGWAGSFEALVARILADFAARGEGQREAAWIAEVDGERVGCAMCMPDGDSHAARLRLLYVSPDARGIGVGSRLLHSAMDFAASADYPEMRLWTNDVLVSARRLYEAAGFELVWEKEHHDFGVPLVGQEWARAIAAPAADDVRV